MSHQLSQTVSHLEVIPLRMPVCVFVRVCVERGILSTVQNMPPNCEIVPIAFENASGLCNAHTLVQLFTQQCQIHAVLDERLDSLLSF